MELKGYAAIISGATGVKDLPMLSRIEDTMRHVVYHSTLDWQAREELEKGARKAYGLILIADRPKVRIVLPTDQYIAALLGVDATDIPALSREAA